MSQAAAYMRPFVDSTHTRSSMGLSVLLHILLLLAFLLMPKPVQWTAPLTEITLEAGPSDAPAAAAMPAAAPESSPGEVTTHADDQRFRRQSSAAELRPDPQNSTAIDDRLNARLSAIQSHQSAPSIGTVPDAPASMLGTTPATAGGVGTGGHSPVALERGGGGAGPAISLTRGPGTGYSPVLAGAPSGIEHAEAAPAKGGDSAARRTLAGATLMGPIADRAIVSHVTPVYPDWAKSEGVEGTVTLYFIVRPDGSVRENIVVQKTAGFGDFDESARAALRAWRFQPLRDGRVGDQWGTITFQFRLSDHG